MKTCDMCPNPVKYDLAFQEEKENPPLIVHLCKECAEEHLEKVN